jgi:serine/threonine-protein kinase
VQGTELMTAGKLAEACPKLAESMRLDPSIGTGLYLADCFEKTRRSASAWATFREVEDMATKAGDHRADVAKRRADRLEPSLAKLTIVVPSGAEVEGLEIIRDQVVVGRPQWSAAVPVDPGSHVVRARAPHKKEYKTDIDVPAGAGNTRITIPPLADAPDEPPPKPWEPPKPIPPQERPPEDTGTAQRVVGIALGSAGVVAAAVGLVVGLNAKSIYNRSNADEHCIDNHCDEEGTTSRQHAFSAARVSTILSVAGGAAVVAGVVVYLTAPRTGAPVSVKAGLGGIQLETPF